MGKKKQKQETTQQSSFNNTNTYGYTTAPETDDIKNLRNFQFTADPSIGYIYGNARNRAANSFNNPLGGYYSPEIRDRILQSTLGDLSQQQGQATSVANQQLQGARYGQLAGIAGMTAPRLIQTGSSGTGTGSGTSVTTQSGGLLESLLAGGAMGASAALGNPALM